MSSIVSAGTLRLLALLQRPGVGPKTVWKEIARLRSPESELDLWEDAYSAEQGQTTTIDETASEAAQRIVDQCLSMGIRILSPLDDGYPRSLTKIPDAPPIIYLRGSRQAIQFLGVAVVGTRHPSDYGVSSARRIASKICSHGATVVSGLALGIDTAAHEGALEVSGTTVAVLAHGLDTVHPPQNFELAQRIVNGGGALLSEHPPGFPAYRTQFVRRNRIQSGLSRHSIIVESGKKGGSIRQAEYAARQGRQICVVLPERITAQNSDYDMSGSLYLVEHYGARPLKTADDVDDLLRATGEDERGTR